MWGAAQAVIWPYTCSVILGVELRLRTFIVDSQALKHLVVYQWSGPHAVAAENISSKKTIIIYFPHMTLLKSLIVAAIIHSNRCTHEPCSKLRGTDGCSLKNNCKIGIHDGVPLETYSSTKKQFQNLMTPWRAVHSNYQFTVEYYWMVLCLIPGLYSNHNKFWGDFPMSAEASPSTAAHSSSSESNSQCHTKFHSLADPPFQL